MGPSLLQGSVHTHNVEALIWKRHCEVARNPLWKLVSWREWRARAKAEQRYLREADHGLAVSQTDADFSPSSSRADKLTVIPTGVDIEYFGPLALEEEPNSLVFTGSMDAEPRWDSLFCRGDPAGSLRAIAEWAAIGGGTKTVRSAESFGRHRSPSPTPDRLGG